MPKALKHFLLQGMILLLWLLFVIFPITDTRVEAQASCVNPVNYRYLSPNPGVSVDLSIELKQKGILSLMLSARQLILAALAMLVIFGTNAAQTANEMRQKYGSPDEKGHYLVRPEIGMSVSFGKDGQACKVLIKSLPHMGREASFSEGLDSEMVSQIIDEIVPISVRGLRGRKISFSGHVTVTDYENVAIRRTMVSKWDNSKGEREAEIVWKKRDCE